MDKIDVDGFLIKNKFLLIGVIVLIILIIGSVFGIRYYYGNVNKNADKLLWKGIRLYVSFNGKNKKVIYKSVSYLKKLRHEYVGTSAYKISNFYTGLDYMKIGNFKKAKSYLTKYIAAYPKPGPDNLTYLAYGNLATVSIFKKDYKNAILDFAKMSKIDGVKLQEYAMLKEATLYTQIKEPKKAVSIYKAMLTNDAMTKDRGYIENLIQLNS
ncbi:tetratricopeptide repeat protein [Candidatus Acidulodesulfobacterium sp. H_13]|uniref:tetratricopeptide repeat protein n=1 Tax=Candidatus Acidulodesulfobacterium sp. H_13 TaxID=3395470 RepID=UPI003AF610A1